MENKDGILWLDLPVICYFFSELAVILGSCFMPLQDIIDSMPCDNKDKMRHVLTEYVKFDNNQRGKEDMEESFELYIEFMGLIISTARNMGMEIEKPPEFRRDSYELVVEVRKYIDRLINRFNYAVGSSLYKDVLSKYDKHFGGVFLYNFDDDDIGKINKIIFELREVISSSSCFDDEFKQRILGRLEKLQAELHKKVSDLDRFWGLIGDAGVAVGKAGKEAKPIVDRIKELTAIVWKAQSKSEGLPAPETDLPRLECEDA